MGKTLYTAPATEPVTLAEVMAHLRLDESNQEPAPGALTAALASPAAAGNVDNGAHRYLATFVTADGETQAGTVSSAVTVADKTVNGKVALSNIPLGGSAVTARKLYRTAAGGSTYLLLATLADNTTTTYTDNIADSSLGAGAPSTNTTSDPLLTALITAARTAAEKLTGRALITQTWDVTLDEFPDDGDDSIDLPYPPLASVTSITYLDTDGTRQTLSSSVYQVVTDEIIGRVLPAYGQAWPSCREQPGSIVVRYACGYGAAASVPQPIKQWMLMRIAALYEQRHQLVVGAPNSEIPRSLVDGLLDPYLTTRF